MRTFIITNESINEEVPTNDQTTSTDALLLQAEINNNQATSLSEAGVDGVDVFSTLDQMSTATPEQAVAIATEHLLKNITKSKNNITLESYALESNQLKNKLNSNLSIAQEGIFSRFSNTVKLFFTSEEKIHENVISAIENMESRGAKTDVIKEPGWGRSFSRSGKRIISPSDALNTLQNYSKSVTNNEFNKLVKDYTDFIEKISSELSRSRFIADDDAIANIQRLNSVADEIRSRADKIIASADSIAKSDPDFAPLTIQDAKKLSKDVQSIMTNSSFKTIEKRFEQAISNANLTIFMEANTRLLGTMASDMKAAQALIYKVNPALCDIIDMIHRKNRLCFACVNYIKASTL